VNKPISVGDLVCVVRGLPCCKTVSPWIGKFFTVTEIHTEPNICMHCGYDAMKTVAYNGEFNPISGRHWGISISRLIRIDPLSEPESTTSEETSHA
jgi:hypothetical protein